MNQPRRADISHSTQLEVPGVQLGEVLGRGGFATVYAAEQTSLERQVAVKIDSRPLDTERNRRRFLREMNAASRISGHPHVVSLIDAGVLPDGRPYLVMERCDGGSLAGIDPSSALPPETAVRIVEAVSSALGAAHAAGVLHRDIKPGNILLDSYGSPRLSDFGIAAIQREEHDSSVTLEALTPAFASPEAFHMQPPTAAGDIWSMGAVLIALLTGRGPRTNPDGRPQTITEIYQGLDQPVNLDHPNIPPALRPVLTKAMHPMPAQRYHNGTELAAALTQTLPMLSAATPTMRLRAPHPTTVMPVTHSPTAPPSQPQPMVGSAPRPTFEPPAASTPSPPTSTVGPAPQPTPSSPQFAAAQPGPPMGFHPAHPGSAAESRRNRSLAWGVAAGLAIAGLVTVAVVWGLPALNARNDAAAPAVPASSAVADTRVPSPTPTENVPTTPTPQPTSAPPVADTPSLVNDQGIPYSPNMPWQLGTCMNGRVDDQGISSAVETSCDVGNWQVFAGGEFAPDNPGRDAGEALSLDTQVTLICNDSYAARYGLDVTVPHEIRVLGPLDHEWEAGERGFSCVFATE